MFKNKLGVAIVLFVLTLITRTFWLDRFPTGITNDELHFVLNAKAVWYGFTDMSGVWNPLSLTSIPDNPSAELTSPFLAPFLGPITLNLFTTRFIFAIMSSLLVVVIYLIAWEINPTAGIISGLVAIINPWFFYFGRTAFDQPIALFFLTLSFYALLKLKNKWIFLSLIPLLLGFYTYIGTKVIFFPYILFTVYFCWQKNKRKYTTQYLAIVTICLLATVQFVYTTFTGPSRISELISPMDKQITETVIIERAQSLPSPLNRIFVNKYTEYAYFFTNKYLNNFSPNVMFSKGDEAYLLSFWKHGYFYYLDIIFLIIGAYYLFRKHRKYFLIFLTAILLSPIPEALRRDLNPVYHFHSSLQHPFLVIFIGAGIYTILDRFPRLSIPIILVYLVLFIELLNLYFFRYPIYVPEGFGLSTRVMSNYVMLERKNGKEVVVITNEPSSVFRQYLFYTQGYTKENFESIKMLYQKNRQDITFDHVRFVTHTVDMSFDKNIVYLTQANYFQFNEPHLSIKQISSGLQMYYLFNSTICPALKRQDVVTIKNSELNIEKLSSSDLCRLFISID